MIGEVIAELPDAEKLYATLALYEELEDAAIGEVLQLSADEVEVLRVTTEVMITHGLRKRLNEREPTPLPNGEASDRSAASKREAGASDPYVG